VAFDIRDARPHRNRVHKADRKKKEGQDTTSTGADELESGAKSHRQSFQKTERGEEVVMES